MRLTLALAAATVTLVSAADADTMKNCAAAWKAKSADAVAAKTYEAWSTTCLKADYHIAPTATEAPPAGATAKCKDGTYSMSKTASGRCSSHSGVDKIL